MQYRLSNKTILELSCDYELCFVEGDKIENLEDKDVLELCKFGEGDVMDVPTSRIVYASLEDKDLESIRLVLAKVVSEIKGYKIKSLKTKLPVNDASIEDIYAAFVEGFELSMYSFDKYKSDAEKSTLDELVLCEVADTDLESAEKGLDRGLKIANATNYVRDIVNEIPQVYTPQKMAEDAKALTELEGVSCETFGKEYLKEQNMNAFLAVNQASPHDPVLVHMTYKPSGESKGKYAFVGKGLTYDTGGLSLKPTRFMLTMKSDKGGAAAALGVIKAAAELKLPFEVHAVLGCTENAIGGKAYKPDDIIRTREGVTIEVTDTDAEGRLVLADCLSWAQDMIKPDYLFDMATLTGSISVGIGIYTTGIIGNSMSLQHDFKVNGEKSGELLSIMEFNKHLRPLIKSEIADIKNSVSGGSGGAITAGLFLDKFIKPEYKDKWLHLDIAGPAYAESAWGYNHVGGTGAGVRFCVYYLLSKM